MKHKPFTLLYTLLISFIILIPGISHANVGTAKMVLGKVMLLTQQGEKKRLRRGNSVRVGDTIITNKRGQAQLTMIDGTKISVRPDSKFQIEAFVAEGKPKDQKTYYKLLKGGFRSVTGKIGKRNKSSFRLSTPVATMGIRGTDFTGKYCADDCPAAAGKNGLFVDVISGGVSMANDGGTFDLNKDTNGYVSDPTNVPKPIAELPDNLLSPKAKKSKNGKRRNKPKYPSPEEEMVQVGLYVAPNDKKAILSEAMDAGVPPAEIMSGADTAGLEAKNFLPDLIEKGKEKGLDPSDFVESILDSGINSDTAINNLMSHSPEAASDILTAAIATGDFDNKELKKSASRAGVPAKDIESADTVGNLFALPPEVKKLLKEDNNKKADADDEEDDEPRKKRKKRAKPKELTPSNDSGEVASPS